MESYSTFIVFYEGFTYPEGLPDPESSFTRSLFWPNEATFHGHPRFKTLTGNIRQRRGEKVIIYIFHIDFEIGRLKLYKRLFCTLDKFIYPL